MTEFSSLAHFASFLAGAVVEMEHHKHEALERAANLIETEAKRAIGTYEYNWPQLAESTQEQRTQLGYSPNDPLLRSGAQRDSYKHSVGHDQANIGSNDDKAVYSELGSKKEPPRPVLLGAAVRKEHEVLELLGHGAVVALLNG